VHEVLQWDLAACTTETSMPTGELRVWRWLYGTILWIIRDSASMGATSGDQSTRQTTVPQRRHSATISLAHCPNLLDEYRGENLEEEGRLIVSPGYGSLIQRRLRLTS